MDEWHDLVQRLKARGLVFEPGLAGAEIASAESRFGFRFPPDLRDFLQTALPCGEGFPDWRDGDEMQLKDWLDRPREGVVFDIEHNAFWLPEWGSRPDSPPDAIHIAEQMIAAAPRLIPVFAHRMMPDFPATSGNPVFSVHQTDIIVYGRDLHTYLVREFLVTDDEERASAKWWPDDTRKIPFWDVDRFQQVRWGPDGICVFDNRRGILP